MSQVLLDDCQTTFLVTPNLWHIKEAIYPQKKERHAFSLGNDVVSIGVKYAGRKQKSTIKQPVISYDNDFNCCLVIVLVMRDPKR